MLRNFKVDYDEANDTLFLYRGKSSGSVELGNFVFDFDANEALVAMEILDAEKSLSMLNTGKKFPKGWLSDVARCKIDFRVHRGIMVLKLYLYLEPGKEFVTSIALPSISEHSPLAAET